MDAKLLAMLFGIDRRWSGPCTVILDSAAHVQSIGSDAIVQGGIKAYSPRLITGRVPVDHALLISDLNALLMVKRTVTRQSTGEDQVSHVLQVVDLKHIAAVEFDRLDNLQRLGVAAP